MYTGRMWPAGRTLPTLGLEATGVVNEVHHVKGNGLGRWYLTLSFCYLPLP